MASAHSKRGGTGEHHPLGCLVTLPVGRLVVRWFALPVRFANLLPHEISSLPYLRGDLLGVLHHERAEGADHDAGCEYDQSDHLLLLDQGGMVEKYEWFARDPLVAARRGGQRRGLP